MSDINLNLSDGDLTETTNETCAVITPGTMRMIARAVALFTSAISSGIAMFSGMQRTGTAMEQV